MGTRAPFQCFSIAKSGKIGHTKQASPSRWLAGRTAQMQFEALLLRTASMGVEFCRHCMEGYKGHSYGLFRAGPRVQGFWA